MFAKGYYQNTYSKEDIEADKLFEEVSDEENDEELELPKNSGDTDTISILLAAYCGECEELPEKFRKHGIKYENLSSVTAEDLDLMGLKDPKSQQKLLDSLADLPNQVPHFDNVINNLNTENYNNQVVKNIAIHMNNLKTSLMAAEIIFGIMAPEDILLEDELYASDLVLKTIDQMLANTEKLELALDELKPISAMKPMWWRTAIGFNLLAGTLAVTSFLCYKYLK